MSCNCSIKAPLAAATSPLLSFKKSRCLQPMFTILLCDESRAFTCSSKEAIRSSPNSPEASHNPTAARQQTLV